MLADEPRPDRRVVNFSAFILEHFSAFADAPTCPLVGIRDLIELRPATGLSSLDARPKVVGLDDPVAAVEYRHGAVAGNDDDDPVD